MRPAELGDNGRMKRAAALVLSALAVTGASAVAGCSQVADTAKSAASNAASQVAATAKAEASKALASAASQASASAAAAASKLDVNTASRADLVTTLQSAGVPADKSGSLADGIIAGRPYTPATVVSKVSDQLANANIDVASIVRIVTGLVAA